MTSEVVVGDCRDVMRDLAAESIDAIVCDPPYGLEFMGKEWDKLAAQPNHKLRPRKDMGAAPDTEKGNPWASERPSYGAPKKNPVCLTCGRHKLSGSPCTCDAPRWDTRTREYAQVMQEWHEAWAREAYRVLKPGGHLLAFGGSRTYHRLACAIEDAGFEIRDQLQWLYGSGFPKSLDVSKAMDKAAGAERGVVGWSSNGAGNNGSGAAPSDERTDAGKGIYGEGHKDFALTAPATDLAQRWQGFGTALKPAHEPIVLARKPLLGTVAANVAEHGTGALNIDGTRISVGDGDYARNCSGDRGHADNRKRDLDFAMGCGKASSLGRWPANVCLDEDAAALLDAQSGERKSGTAVGGKGNAASIYGTMLAKRSAEDQGYGDTGGASRFFYCAKSSRAERNAGLDGLPERAVRDSGAEFGKMSMWNGENGDEAWKAKNPNKPTANHHPTVKPISLMRWLVRLITPPGGLVFDPFLGSGSTGCAAAYEGFDFLGCDLDAEYVEIARRRIAHHAALAEESREKPSPQLALFDGEAA